MRKLRRREPILSLTVTPPTKPNQTKPLWVYRETFCIGLLAVVVQTCRETYIVVPCARRSQLPVIQKDFVKNIMKHNGDVPGTSGTLWIL